MGVALRKESVDRNPVGAGSLNTLGVALRKESVDRNMRFSPILKGFTGSLSARRAWIEIAVIRRAVWAYYVALRKESVDRNIPRGQLPTPEPPSLSARRAWIEMLMACQAKKYSGVALRKESVDRNECVEVSKEDAPGRSPQGERG